MVHFPFEVGRTAGGTLCIHAQQDIEYKEMKNINATSQVSRIYPQKGEVSFDKLKKKK